MILSLEKQRALVKQKMKIFNYIKVYLDLKIIKNKKRQTLSRCKIRFQEQRYTLKRKYKIFDESYILTLIVFLKKRSFVIIETLKQSRNVKHQQWSLFEKNNSFRNEKLSLRRWLDKILKTYKLDNLIIALSITIKLNFISIVRKNLLGFCSCQLF